MGILRRKVPELALEAVSVVFAVIVALAVDEWREDHSNALLAQRALDGIAAEIRGNQGELDGAREPNTEFLAGLQSLVSGETGGAAELSLDFEYSLLSAAAWQTAQVTQAAHYIDYETVREVARMYDLQALFDENQRGIVEMIGGGAVGPDAPARLAGRLRVLMELESGLTDAYAETLERLGPGGV